MPSDFFYTTYSCSHHYSPCLNASCGEKIYFMYISVLYLFLLQIFHEMRPRIFLLSTKWFRNKHVCIYVSYTDSFRICFTLWPFSTLFSTFANQIAKWKKFTCTDQRYKVSLGIYVQCRQRHTLTPSKTTKCTLKFPLNVLLFENAFCKAF